MQDENTKTEPCKNTNGGKAECIYCHNIWNCDDVKDEEAKMWKRFRQSWRV